MSGPLRFNADVVDTGTPPIPAARAWMTRYSGHHGPPIDLSQAAPGAPPPDMFLDEIARAARDPNSTRYGAILGDMDLREAFAAESSTLYGAPVDTARVAITAGCNLAFMAATLAVAQAGDEVIILEPAYFNHSMALKMLGIHARVVPGDPASGFQPNIGDIASAITDRTRALVVVSPSNPTGAIVPPSVLAALYGMCQTRGIALILDETYRDFLAPGQDCPHSLFSDPAWGDTLISLYSFSKAYAIPGHRIGALTAGEATMAQVLKILDTIQICASRPAQIALARAMPRLGPWKATMRASINARIQAFSAVLADAPGWQIASIGAYFAYVRPPITTADSAVFAEALASTCGVLGLPGRYFESGDSAYLRLAFANADEATIATLPARFANLRAP